MMLSNKLDLVRVFNTPDTGAGEGSSDLNFKVNISGATKAENQAIAFVVNELVDNLNLNCNGQELAEKLFDFHTRYKSPTLPGDVGSIQHELVDRATDLYHIHSKALEDCKSLDRDILRTLKCAVDLVDSKVLGPIAKALTKRNLIEPDYDVSFKEIPSKIEAVKYVLERWENYPEIEKYI